MSIRTRIIQKLIHINELIFFYPSLKKQYKNLLPKNNLNIIDIGSNKGQSIDFFLKLNSDAIIHGFEPNKKLFNYLRRRYESNKKIRLYNLGISAVQGELMFNENILDETSTFEQLNYNSEYLKKKSKILGVDIDKIVVDSYMVKTVRLRDFLNDNPNVDFDVLKIDVEGHELQCLNGLFNGLNTNIPIGLIQLESHNDDMYIKNNQQKEIESILNENGFYQIAQIKHGFGDFHEIIYKNKNYNEAKHSNTSL